MRTKLKIAAVAIAGQVVVFRIGGFI